MRTVALVGLVVSGCCKPPAASAPVADPDPVAAEPPASRFYEGLFEVGAKWTYRVTRTYESFEPDEEEEAPEEPEPEEPEEPEAPEPEERATCWVESVRLFPGGKVSDIMCETPEPRDAEELVAVWVVDVHGLWQAGYEALEDGWVPDQEGEPFIARPPVELHEETPDDPDPNVWEERGWVVDVTQEGDDVWCRSEVYNATHAQRFKVCFDPKGPLWWSNGWDGVSDSEDARFDRID